MSPFWKGAGRKRRDANEKAIVDALKARGWSVRYLGGRGLPDLLVGLPGGKWRVLEVKSAKGKRTEAQATAPWPIVRTEVEAIAACEGFERWSDGTPKLRL